MREFFVVDNYSWGHLSPDSDPPGLREKIFAGTFLENIFVWLFPPYRTAQAVNYGFLKFLDACGDGPCFAFANYMEPPSPFIPSPRHADLFLSDIHQSVVPDGGSEWERFTDFYDAEIFSLDARLGELFDDLETRGVLDQAWVIITSDHGESFGEHGVRTHGTSLYNEQVRIPLIIKPPRGIRIPMIDEPVSLVDIATTMTQLGTQQPLGFGVSLLDSTLAREPAKLQYFGAHEWREMYEGAADHPMRAVASRSYKLIDHGSEQEIYDLSADLKEENNLVDTLDRVIQGQLLEIVPEMPIAYPAPGADAESTTDEEELTEEEKKTLRALGYLQ